MPSRSLVCPFRSNTINHYCLNYSWIICQTSDPTDSVSLETYSTSSNSTSSFGDGSSQSSPFSAFSSVAVTVMPSRQAKPLLVPPSIPTSVSTPWQPSSAGFTPQPSSPLPPACPGEPFFAAGPAMSSFALVPAAGQPMVITSPRSALGSIAQITLLAESISKAGHIGWYRQANEGGCPREASARPCPYLSLWNGVPPSLSATTVRLWLASRHVVCNTPTRADQKSITNGLLGIFHKSKKSKEKLCSLHQVQPAWCKRGSTCVDECCYNHTWPEKKRAPLLYVPHLSPLQAIVLLHFGMYTKDDVERLVQQHTDIALFVSHLLHNNGPSSQHQTCYFIESSFLQANLTPAH